MNRYIELLSAGKLKRFRAVITAALTLPGLAVLFLVFVLGHILAYLSWREILIGWSPAYIAPLTGATYLALLVCSVLAHEIGHLAAAVYRGNHSAKIYVRLSGMPQFITLHNPAQDESGSSGISLDLAGIAAQLLFASLLGIAFFFTGMASLPASVLLIDIGAMSSLVPTPGTDGFRFILDMERKRGSHRNAAFGLKGESANRNSKAAASGIKFSPAIVAAGIGLNLLYLSVTLALAAGIIIQWQYIFLANHGPESQSMLFDVVGFALLLIPAAVYAYWAIFKASFIYRFVRYCLKKALGHSKAS